MEIKKPAGMSPNRLWFCLQEPEGLLLGSAVFVRNCQLLATLSSA